MRHLIRMGFRGRALGRSLGASPGAPPNAPIETADIIDKLEPSGVTGGRGLRGGGHADARRQAERIVESRHERARLSAGTMLRLAIGFLTWLVAARLYSTSEVGTAAAAISAMLLCVQIGTLGVDLAIIALFPRHRDNPARLLDTGITLGTATALLSGLGFVRAGCRRPSFAARPRRGAFVYVPVPRSHRARRQLVDHGSNVGRPAAE